MAVSIDLDGRRALVTGGGQSVGRGIALTLGVAGAEVAVNDLVASRAEEVAAEIVAAGGRAFACAFDVTDFDGVMASVEGAGPFDILVNNAGNVGRPDTMGMGDFGMVVDTTPADWEPYLKVNLYGVMHCTRAALPGMIEGGWGRVITVISDTARVGEPYMAAYSAAKAGAAGFSRSVAREVGRHGITVNCVAIATMRPPNAPPDDELTEEQAAQLQKTVSRYIIRRRGTPDDVAALITFLASPQASWITGQTYPLNGGYSVSL